MRIRGMVLIYCVIFWALLVVMASLCFLFIIDNRTKIKKQKNAIATSRYPILVSSFLFDTAATIGNKVDIKNDMIKVMPKILFWFFSLKREFICK